MRVHEPFCSGGEATTSATGQAPGPSALFRYLLLPNMFKQNPSEGELRRDLKMSNPLRHATALQRTGELRPPRRAQSPCRAGVAARRWSCPGRDQVLQSARVTCCSRAHFGIPPPLHPPIPAQTNPPTQPTHPTPPHPPIPAQASPVHPPQPFPSHPNRKEGKRKKRKKGKRKKRKKEKKKKGRRKSFCAGASYFAPRL